MDAYNRAQKRAREKAEAVRQAMRDVDEQHVRFDTLFIHKACKNVLLHCR